MSNVLRDKVALAVYVAAEKDFARHGWTMNEVSPNRFTYVLADAVLEALAPELRAVLSRKPEARPDDLKRAQDALRHIARSADTLSPQEFINVAADGLGVDRHEYAGEAHPHTSIIEYRIAMSLGPRVRPPLWVVRAQSAPEAEARPDAQRCPHGKTVDEGCDGCFNDALAADPTAARLARAEALMREYASRSADRIEADTKLYRDSTAWLAESRESRT